MDRDDHIKFNLDCYLPYILECVDATHLLQHLDYYSSAERCELNKLSKTAPAEAARRAFDILMQKDSPGVFTALLQSFEDVHPKIVKLLQGDVVKCDENYRHIITVFTQEIIKQIEPIDLLVHLRRYDVITEGEAEEARAEFTNHGAIRAAWFIVTSIHRHIEDWFQCFIKALIDTRCEHLAVELDRDMVQKIKTQREYSPANEDINEERVDDVREHIQEETVEVLRSSKLRDNPKCLSEATLAESDAAGYICAKTEFVDGANITGNQEKDLKDTKILNVSQDQDEITAQKQLYGQNDTEKETVEDTDDESTDEDTDNESADELEDFNDLDKLSPVNDANDEDSTRNISTDVDKITAVEEHNIKLRGYQEKLAQKGCEGENVIIMAPTNSGKTKVACQIVHSLFKRCEQEGKTGKAAFIVDKEELAFQQGKVFEEELPGYRTKVITGEVQQSKNQHLKEYIHRRDVLVITAQVLLNCMKAKDAINLDVFDIIVFDECHHTDKKHPYKKIMDDYFEQKLANAVALPQIVGLTASIGVGGKLDRNAAFENMKQIAANLDTVVICTVEDAEDIAEMKTYINDPDESIVTVPRRKTERFYEDILDTMEKIDTFMTTNTRQLEGDDSFMKKISRVPTSTTGTPQFQSWLSDFKKGLSILTSDNARQILNPCLYYLEQYHLAVMIYNDARINDALDSLQKFVNERRQADFNNEADQFLLQLFDDLQSKSYVNEPENPKLLKLKDLICDTMGEAENSRGIVFVKTKVLAKILKKWMHELDGLRELNARVFLGKDVDGRQLEDHALSICQSVHSEKLNPAIPSGSYSNSNTIRRMTKRKQRDVLALFKNGKHKIIIATTVAEEGLDIAKCNLVIKYEHVTNEKARVQCRGRARAENSKYYVLTEQGSNIVEKEEFNARCEKLMEELIPELRNYIERNRNRWEDEILQMQRNAKEVREAQSRQRQAIMTDEIVNLHCVNCGSLICSSDDIKKVCGMHHIVVSQDIREKVVLRHSLTPRHEDTRNDVIMGGDTFCSNRLCLFKHKIGGIIQYKKMDFPVLAIKNICVKTLTGKPLPPAAKWSKVCFKVESIETVDLLMFVHRSDVI